MIFLRVHFFTCLYASSSVPAMPLSLLSLLKWTHWWALTFSMPFYRYLKLQDSDLSTVFPWLHEAFIYLSLHWLAKSVFGTLCEVAQGSHRKLLFFFFFKKVGTISVLYPTVHWTLSGHVQLQFPSGRNTQHFWRSSRRFLIHRQACSITCEVGPLPTADYLGPV